MTNIQEVIDEYQELQRLHQLNIEILEQLAVTCDFIVKNHINIPNSNALASLLNKAMLLLDEIQADEPKTLMYSVSRRKVTDKDGLLGTDGEVTVPEIRYCEVLVT